MEGLRNNVGQDAENDAETERVIGLVTEVSLAIKKHKSHNLLQGKGLPSEGDGNRTRNHRIDSPVL